MTHTYASAGLRLFRAGFQPIPVAGKRPVVKDWQGMTLHEDQIGFWADGDKGTLNVGLRTDDLVAIDIDIYHQDVADEVEAAVRARFGNGLRRNGEAPKRLLLYAAKKPGPKITSPIFHTVDGMVHRVEILGAGQQFVAHGIHPDTLRAYAWPDRDILDVERWELPVVDRDEVGQWVHGELTSALMRKGWLPKYSDTAAPSAPGAYAPDPEDAFDAVKARHDDVSLDELRWMLENLAPSYCDDRDTWRNAIFAIHHQFGHTEQEAEAFDLVDAWSANSTKYTAGCVAGIWREAKDQRGAGLVTIGTLKSWLGEAWKGRKAVTTGAVQAEAATTWGGRIAAADEATLRGPLVAEIRAADIDLLTRATLVKRYQDRFKELTGVSVPVAEVRRLLAPLRPAQDDAEAAPIDDPFFMGPDWARDWFWVTGEDKFFHRGTKQLCSVLSFNSLYKWDRGNLLVPEGDEINLYTPYDRMVTHWRVRMLDRTGYHPLFGETFELGGLTYANTYRADLYVKPDAAFTDAGRRFVAAIERHLSLILPDIRERNLFRAWLAHNYRCPGVKIRWAPLLKGAEGDGKSVFGELLQALLGMPNVRMMSADTIQTSPFSGWATGQCLVVLEEVRFQGHNRWDVVNRLKPYISNNSIELHGKGKDPITALNVSNYLALTNHDDALPLGKGDRRYFVLCSPFQTKEELHDMLMACYGITRNEHFDEIFDLGREFPGQVALWLSQVQIPDEFKADGEAPHTDAKRRMVDAAKRDIDCLVAAILEDGAVGVSTAVVHPSYLREALKREGCEADMPARGGPEVILRQLGYVRSDKKIRWQGQTSRSVWVLPERQDATTAWIAAELNATTKHDAFND